MMPKVIEPPEAEPITVAEARAHLEAPSYGDSDVDPADDDMIEAWIGAAREHCENYLGRSLSTRTLEIALDEFPCHRSNGWFHGWRTDSNSFGASPIALPMGPVREVYTVSWGDESDDELANDQFVLDVYSSAPAIFPLTTWPTVTRATNAIKIRYLAGYGVDSEGGEPLPKSIRAAILLVLGHLYANREETTEASLMTLPLGVKVLLDPYRVRLGFA